MPGILGRKLGMTRVFQDDGNVIPVTLLSCPPSTVTQVKTAETDGYPAIVLGFEALKKPRKTKKFRRLKEFRVEKPEEYKVGDQVTVEKLKEVKEVVISGISKGKGFAGFIKRHHFSSGPGSHGSHFKREPGSIGARSKPGRIHKGRKMAGHMGFERKTIKRIPIIQVDAEKNLLVVKGQVPGPQGGIIEIKF
ncbi:50S ribosomal protein L3 [Candidatus Peregrinibacteria bacterium]|nr:50S ribosomal protein L3 [Candidatus Peregrinibacteria bacterium]